MRTTSKRKRMLARTIATIMAYFQLIAENTSYVLVSCSYLMKTVRPW